MGSDDNCLSVTGRVVLGILNTLVLVIGFVLLILGILVFAYTPAFDFIFDGAKAEFASAGAGGSSDFNAERILDLVKALAYILIGLGVFFFIIGLLGLIGGCCKIKFALIVYIILLVLLIIGQIVLMIIVFSQRQVIEPSMKQPLLDMVNKYERYDGTGVDTVTMNFLMITLQCCGVNNYQDFKKQSQSGSWNSVVNGQDLTTPLVCCVNRDASSTACAENPGYMDPTLNNANKGCYNELWNVIDTERDLMIGIFSAIIVLQTILALFAIYIVYRMVKAQKIGYQ